MKFKKGDFVLVNKHYPDASVHNKVCEIVACDNTTAYIRIYGTFNIYIYKCFCIDNELDLIVDKNIIENINILYI